MKPFTGTGALIRLALRRDRIKLPLWVAAIAGLTAMSVPIFKATYETAADIALYAGTTASSVAARIMAGPIDGPNIGSIVMVELFMFLAILTAFMSTLLVVRHTRQNEELGRSELVGSLVVGRHSALAAALAVAVIANVLLATLLGLILQAHGMGDGAFAMGGAVGAVGLFFAGVAAVTVQLTESARVANSMAAIVIGIAFLIRGIGDALGEVAADGLSATSMWLSWLSPIGWGQHMQPFADTQLWPLGLYAAGAVLLAGIGFYLSTQRDVGSGLRQAQKGPAHASSSLLSPLGLAWRLQRGALIGWTIGVAILGGLIGITSVEFKDLLSENEVFADFVGGDLTSGTITDSYFAAMLAISAVAIAGYVTQGLQRLRSEEAGGQVESLLATNVSRARWVASHGICVIGGVGILLVTLGISAATSYILAEPGASWGELFRLTGAALTHAPAILAFAGAVIAVFGILPRALIAISWTAFAFCLLVAWLGSALNFPQWLMNISPFAHIPSVPGNNVPVGLLAAITAAAIILIAVGLIAFRRRDVKAG